MLQNRRILIVDDQQDLREQLAKLLLRSGKTNETASLVQGIRARLGKKEEAPDDAASASVKNITDQEYEVETAGQGEQAFEMVKKSLEDGQPYAMMFTDMRMPPGWDGLETAKRIREIDKNIEIVIMTAFADHDQKVVAQTIGTPHKLLYIKKPFQSEEIFQLALSLTAKWNFEETERIRKEWLEILIRCMSKVKTVNTGNIKDIYGTILKSILTFTGTDKGFIVNLTDSGSWSVEDSQGLESMEVDNFIKQNSDRLINSRTTQHFDGKYILPLKRESFSAVACIYNVETQNDPEWYKLMSLLVMTSSEVLSSALLASSAIKKEQFHNLSHALKKISSIEMDTFGRINAAAESIKKQSGESEELNIINDNVAMAQRRLGRINDIMMLAEADDSGFTRENAVIAELLRNACNEAAKLADEFPIELNIKDEDVAKLHTAPELLARAFRNLAINACEAARKAGKEKVTLTAEITQAKNIISIRFADDGPGINPEMRDSFLEPFNSDSDKKMGIGLSVARVILEKLHGGLFFDVNYKDGACFNIKLSNPQA
ncbi:MAG: response regulator [Victivallales bacterium]|nr:response regulator [Victivallales bacterium]